jgi:hypothetical protein
LEIKILSHCSRDESVQSTLLHQTYAVRVSRFSGDNRSQLSISKTVTIVIYIHLFLSISTEEYRSMLEFINRLIGQMADNQMYSVDIHGIYLNCRH